MLHQRMARHREQAGALLDRALLLDYAGAEQAAGAILGEARLARPPPGQPDLLNARLPDRFFQLQSELTERASEVRAAAQAHDPERLARASGEVTRTCVSCHAAYLGGASR